MIQNAIKYNSKRGDLLVLLTCKQKSLHRRESLHVPENDSRQIDNISLISSVNNRKIFSPFRHKSQGGTSSAQNQDELSKSEPQSYILETEIIDTGLGIEKARHKHLFKPFQEVKQEGNIHFVQDFNIGMGLACSSQITHSLDGDIILKQSQPGLTIFGFKIQVQVSSVTSQNQPSEINLQKMYGTKSSLNPQVTAFLEQEGLKDIKVQSIKKTSMSILPQTLSMITQMQLNRPSINRAQSTRDFNLSAASKIHSCFGIRDTINEEEENGAGFNQKQGRQSLNANAMKSLKLTSYNNFTKDGNFDYQAAWKSKLDRLQGKINAPEWADSFASSAGMQKRMMRSSCASETLSSKTKSMDDLLKSFEQEVVKKQDTEGIQVQVMGTSPVEDRMGLPFLKNSWQIHSMKSMAQHQSSSSGRRSSEKGSAIMSRKMRADWFGKQQDSLAFKNALRGRSLKHIDQVLKDSQQSLVNISKNSSCQPLEVVKLVDPLLDVYQDNLDDDRLIEKDLRKKMAYHILSQNPRNQFVRHLNYLQDQGDSPVVADESVKNEILSSIFLQEEEEEERKSEINEKAVEIIVSRTESDLGSSPIASPFFGDGRVSKTVFKLGSNQKEQREQQRKKRTVESPDRVEPKKQVIPTDKLARCAFVLDVDVNDKYKIDQQESCSDDNSEHDILVCTPSKNGGDLFQVDQLAKYLNVELREEESSMTNSKMRPYPKSSFFQHNDLLMNQEEDDDDRDSVSNMEDEESLEIEDENPSQVVAGDHCCPPLVLVVDDMEMNIIPIQAMLKEFFSIDIEKACDGQDAVTKCMAKLEKKCGCENQFYKLILMDIQMPVMDGIQATKQIKRIISQANSVSQGGNMLGGNAQGGIFESKIVGISAYTNKRAECLKAGMSDFYNKPLKATHLYHIMYDHFYIVSHSQKMDALRENPRFKEEDL